MAAELAGQAAAPMPATWKQEVCQVLRQMQLQEHPQNGPAPAVKSRVQMHPQPNTGGMPPPQPYIWGASRIAMVLQMSTHADSTVLPHTQSTTTAASKAALQRLLLHPGNGGLAAAWWPASRHPLLDVAPCGAPGAGPGVVSCALHRSAANFRSPSSPPPSSAWRASSASPCAP